MDSRGTQSILGRLTVAITCLSLILVSQALGYTFTADFGSPSDVAAFEASTNGSPSPNTWTVANGVWEHNFGGSTFSSNIGAQGVLTSGVAGQNFLVATDFTLTARNSGNAWIVSLPILSATKDQFHFGSNNYYLTTLRLSASPNDDRLDLATSVPGDWAGSLTGSGNGQVLPFTISVGTLYHLSATGTYDGGGNLVLSTTLTDVATPSNTFIVTTSPISTPFAGNYFGYRDEAFFDSGTIQYDNFVVTTEIPEPTSLALLALGGLAMLRSRRAR